MISKGTKRNKYRPTIENILSSKHVQIAEYDEIAERLDRDSSGILNTKEGVLFIDSMSEWCGKTLTVLKTQPDGLGENRFKVLETWCTWTPEMVHCIVD